LFYLPSIKNMGVFSLLFLVSCGQLWSQTDVHLRIEKRAFTRLPVELWPCEITGEATEDDGFKVSSVLESDLWLSSLIAAYPAQSQNLKKNTGMTTTRPAGLQAINVAVKTRLEVDGDTATLALALIDMNTKQITFNKKYAGCRKKVRLLVHVVADAIVKRLTGQEGIARSRIVFSASSFDGKEIYVMDYDGVNLERLTHDKSININPAWMPGGKGVVFTSYKANNPDLYFLDLESRRAGSLLASNHLYSSPAWAPSGSQLAVVSTKDGNAEIYKVDARSRKMRRLTHHVAIDAAPSWSPTGREIIFTSDRLGNPQLFLMDAEGSNVRRLPVGNDYNDSPVWSPKGDKVAFVSRGTGGFDIYVYSFADAQTMQLTSNQGSNEDPFWSPDGYRIVFSSTRDGGRDIYSMMWDGTNVEKLTAKGNCSSPSWSANVRPESDFKCKK